MATMVPRLRSSAFIGNAETAHTHHALDAVAAVENGILRQSQATVQDTPLDAAFIDSGSDLWVTEHLLSEPPRIARKTPTHCFLGNTCAGRPDLPARTEPVMG